MQRAGLGLRVLVLAVGVGCGLQAGAQGAVRPGVPKADAAAQAQAEAAWQAQVEKQQAEWRTRFGSGSDAALRTELLGMQAKDQEARGVANGQVRDAGKLGSLRAMTEVDHQLTAELKAIVQDKGWPTIRMVGVEGSEAAMLVLTHSADHEWQRSLLPHLEELADKREIDGSKLALVIDKELVSEGKLQRYGTQFKVVDGGMAMYAVEDPAGLDARRARVLLQPEAAYQRLLEGMYHLKATGRIVMATPAAAPAQ